MPNKRFKWQNRILKIWRCFLGPSSSGTGSPFKFCMVSAVCTAISTRCMEYDILSTGHYGTSWSAGPTSVNKLRHPDYKQAPNLPWIVYFLNRYAVHNDGKPSYQRRWATDHKSPLFEIGETVRIPPSNNQSLTKAWAKVLQWHLAWKRHNDQRVHHRDLRKDHQGENKKEDEYTLKSTTNSWWTWSMHTLGQAPHQHKQFQLAMLPLANLKTASYAIVTQTAVGQQGVSTQTPAQQPPQCRVKQWVHNQWRPHNRAQQQHHQWRHHHQQFHDQHYQCHYNHTSQSVNNKENTRRNNRRSRVETSQDTTRA